MDSKITIALAVVAGFIGGLASHPFVTAQVSAQEQGPTPLEIRAHKFVLVDDKGVVRGAFGIEDNNSPAIEIKDTKGNIFRPGWVTLEGHWKPRPPKYPSQSTMIPTRP